MFNYIMHLVDSVFCQKDTKKEEDIECISYSNLSFRKSTFWEHSKLNNIFDHIYVNFDIVLAFRRIDCSTCSPG